MSVSVKNELLAKLHDIGGVRLEILCSRAVRARRMGLVPEDDLRTVCCRILYLGAPNEEPGALHPENDGYAYASIYSPFSGEPDPLIAYGLYRDRDRNLWTEYYSSVYLKYPGLHAKGIELRMYVPDILAEKSPTLEIKCLGCTIFSTVLAESGEQRIVLDIHDCGEGIAAYMAEVRRQQAVMVGEFMRVCRDLGVRAYLICGGLIGEMRDGDLLPWDDDLDFAMTRADYEILNSRADDIWPKGSPFEWITKDKYEDDVFVDFMTRFVYMGETSGGNSFEKLGDRGRQDLRGHQVIDIYILDDAFSSHFRQKIRTTRIKLLYLLCSAHRGDVLDLGKYSYYGGIKKLLIKAAMWVGRRIDLKDLLKRYDRLTQTRKGGSEEVFQSNGYYLCIPMLFRKEWFGEGVERETEVGKILLPADPDSFLRRMYGDYLKYPATWDRTPSHLKKEEMTDSND
ncbi:MAG: LicD family protein [Oscillospiraceae bacterium]|nr:LicD family protein [Oscillospiraceae bacterium]